MPPRFGEPHDGCICTWGASDWRCRCECHAAGRAVTERAITRDYPVTGAVRPIIGRDSVADWIVNG